MAPVTPRWPEGETLSQLRRSFSICCRRTQNFERAQSGCTARFDAELFENLQHMLFHCRLAIAENCRNVRVGFPLREPQQCFGDARREVQNGFQWFGRLEVGLELWR